MISILCPPHLMRCTVGARVPSSVSRRAACQYSSDQDMSLWLLLVTCHRDVDNTVGISFNRHEAWQSPRRHAIHIEYQDTLFILQTVHLVAFRHHHCQRHYPSSRFPAHVAQICSLHHCHTNADTEADSVKVASDRKTPCAVSSRNADPFGGEAPTPSRVRSAVGVIPLSIQP
jgi:hypothetical protein